MSNQTLRQLAFGIRGARLGHAGECATSQTAAAASIARTGTREFRIAAANAADGRGLLLHRILLFAGRVRRMPACPSSRRPLEKRHRQPVIFARIRAAVVNGMEYSSSERPTGSSKPHFKPGISLLLYNQPLAQEPGAGLYLYTLVKMLPVRDVRILVNR